MERTLMLLKPSAVLRGLMGEVIKRIEQKGLKICGMKMMQLDDRILAEHYSHLVDKPFYPTICEHMKASPIVALCIEGVEAANVVRGLTGVTNGRNAVPGTIRGDFSMSKMENIVHTSDSPESAVVEVKRFFSDDELFSYNQVTKSVMYAPDEV
ncbi:MAG TPA: nucleoside-diphosphate kinase [Porphyromonadaceae bacterium]|nr:nucleoside-diphosphate kinase [Porphyromonadaceae bacterium]